MIDGKKAILPDIPEDKSFNYRILKRSIVLDKLKRKLILENKLDNKEYLKHLNFHKKETM